jgi:hypothetical protein
MYIHIFSSLSPRSYTHKWPLYSYLMQSNPYIVLQPWGFLEVEVLRFQDNRQAKMARLSALRIVGLYPRRDIYGTHFC